MFLHLCKFFILSLIVLPVHGICSKEEKQRPSQICYSLNKEVANLQSISDVESYIQKLCASEKAPNSFHIVDLSELEHHYKLWKTSLPSVTPYYAVKTNHDPMIVKTLAELGTSFDCASADEIKQVLSNGVDPSKIIFAHPIKSSLDIQYARDKGVKTFVFDSMEELEKIEALIPNAQYVLRIKTEDTHSSTPLSEKFGASLKEAQSILDQALARKRDVIGISFHVGSNNTYLPSYEKAIEDAALLFEYASENWGVHFSLLDLGGGWPGHEDQVFIQMTKEIEKILAEKIDSSVQVIAEPGRYFAASSTTAVVRVLGKKIDPSSQTRAYYLSSGVFGPFISSLYYQYESTKLESEGWKFKPVQPKKSTSYDTIFWGPTCDSGDCILKHFDFPEVETGDYLYSKNMGAYTYALETSFNQIPLSKPYYVYSEDPKL